MAGYKQYSMSWNAVEAYGRGERPRSKWSKADILDRCGDKAKFLKALHLEELRKTMLKRCGAHHTSSRYNMTEFYDINDDRLETITEREVDTIIAARPENVDKLPLCEITAEVTFDIWKGYGTKWKQHRKPVEVTETVTYKSTDKVIRTVQGGNKRLSSMKNINVIETRPL